MYKKKIDDTSMFGKQGSFESSFEVVSPDGEKGVFMTVHLGIVGENRQTYSVNDEEKDIGIKLNGVTDAGVEFKADVIEENDPTYIEMTNRINSWGDFIYITAYDLKLIGGGYEGDLILTFDLGEENDGKIVRIAHGKSDGTWEDFEGVVKDGKVSITVTELSPFFLGYKLEGGNEQQGQEQERPDKEDNRELDEEPRTGVNDLIALTSIIALISLVGIIITKNVK